MEHPDRQPGGAAIAHRQAVMWQNQAWSKWDEHKPALLLYNHAQTC
jgi:hypothetical protein